MLKVSVDPGTKGTALLTTNTQVAIAPKPHSSKKLTAPPKTDSNATPKKPPPFRQFLRVLAPRFLPRFTHDKYSGSELLALVSPNVYAELVHSPNPLVSQHSFANPRHDVKHTITYHRCTVRRLKPPRDPSSTKEASTSTRQQTSEKSDNGGESGDKTGVDDDKVVYVGWSTHVPGKHIAPMTMWDGLGEWDNVRCELLH